MSPLSAERSCSRAAKLGDCISARWLMKVHHSLATYHGGAADMNKRCAKWLPTFLQRGIHFFGERTEVLAFNNRKARYRFLAQRFFRASARRFVRFLISAGL